LRSPVPVFRRYSFSVLTQDALRTRIPKVSKPESPVWKNLKPHKGKTKTDGDRLYEWDHENGDIEVYDRATGKHLGSMGLRWVGKSGHWEAKIGYDRGSGKGVLRRGGGGKGEVWIWGQDGDFWKLERKAEQTTERSGVGCGA
jgi:hypothetical protein